MQKERTASNTQNPLTKKVDSNKRMIAFSASRINPNDNDRIERFWKAVWIDLLMI